MTLGGVRVTGAHLAVAAVALLVVLWAVNSLAYPLGVDNGIHAWQGRVLARGGVPYRDAWEHRGPFAMLVNALVQLCFGANTWGIRVFDLLLLGAGLVAVARVDSRSAEDAGFALRWLGAGLLALWVATMPTGSLAQPDLWCGLLLVIGFAPMCRPRAVSVAQYAVAGFVVGLAVLNKPFYVAFLAVPGAHLALRTDVRAAGKARGLAVVTLGAVSPLLACLVWLGAHGMLGEFWSAFIRFNLEVYAQQGRAGLVTRTFDALRHLMHTGPMAAALPLVVVGAATLLRADWRVAVPIGIWTVGTLATVVLQGRNWAHHWAPSLPPLALLAAYAVREVRRLERPAGRNLVAGALAAAALGAAGVDVAERLTPWVAFATGRASRAEFLAAHSSPRFGRYNSASAEEEAAAYLRAHTPADATVLAWGYDATLGFLSGRMPLGRFVYNSIYFLPDSRWRERFRAELLHDMTTRPPYYVVVARPIAVAPATNTTDDTFRDFDALRRLVARDYVLDREIERYALYRRRYAGAASPAPPAAR